MTLLTGTRHALLEKDSLNVQVWISKEFFIGGATTNDKGNLHLSIETQLADASIRREQCLSTR